MRGHPSEAIVIWLLIHVAAYSAVGYEAARVTPRIVRARRKRSHQACLESIMKLEIELGLGLDWALDQLDSLKPALSARSIPGYSSLHERCFRCYGCEKITAFEDYDGRKKANVEDATLMFCNACMRKRVHV